MGKGLAIVGILGSVAATLTMLVLSTEFAAALLVLPILVAGSVVLFLQRSLAGIVAALVVLAFAVLAALGLMGSVTTEDGGTTDFGFSESTGRVLAVVGCLAIPLAVIVVRWQAIEPLAYVGIACILLALVFAIVRRDHLVDQSDIFTLIAGLIPLGAIAPMVTVWRGADEATPTAEAAP